MKKLSLAATALTLVLPVAVLAQNVAVVNGKPVPKARVDALIAQVTKQGQPLTPELEEQAKQEVVLREIFMQEAVKRGIPASPDYQQQMEFARQQIMIRELFEDYKKKNPVTEAEERAEYEKLKAQSSGTEYHVRHILVEKEDDAKALIKQINGGAKFEDVAKKNSKDTGSAENGGDLDWASPQSYVPEFSQAMMKLKKGEMTDTPVKSQFGYHIIRLEDTREAKFPSFEEVKPQLDQRLTQIKLAKYRDELKNKAKTDFKFTN
jgi:peptidyl-prolyl cis-trans isomerase C